MVANLGDFFNLVFIKQLITIINKKIAVSHTSNAPKARIFTLDNDDVNILVFIRSL